MSHSDFEMIYILVFFFILFLISRVAFYFYEKRIDYNIQKMANQLAKDKSDPFAWNYTFNNNEIFEIELLQSNVKAFSTVCNKLYTKVDSLENDIKSIRNMVNANYVDFANYAQSAPKGSEQWTEERLRALEHTMKCVIRVQEEMGIVPCTDSIVRKKGGSDD